MKITSRSSLGSLQRQYDRLRQSLFIKAAKKRSNGLDLATYRRAIDDAVEPDGFID